MISTPPSTFDFINEEYITIISPYSACFIYKAMIVNICCYKMIIDAIGSLTFDLVLKILDYTKLSLVDNI